MRSSIMIPIIFTLMSRVAIADDTISDGLTLTIPSQGATNWYSTFYAMCEDISGHDHTGSGNGVKIGPSALEDNAISGTSFRLANDSYLRARNNAGSGDVNILKVTTGDALSIVPATTFTGAVTLSSALPVASGGTAATTASGARTSLGAAASGTNADITATTALSSITHSSSSVLIASNGSASLYCDSDDAGTDYVNIGSYSDSTLRWRVRANGKLYPPTALQNGVWTGTSSTARRTIATSATLAQTIEALNTLIRDLTELGVLQCSSNCNGL